MNYQEVIDGINEVLNLHFGQIHELLLPFHLKNN